MAPASPVFREDFFLALRGPAAQQVGIEVVPVTGSTSSDLLARIDTLTHPVLRLAHVQTAGRGRAGRSWRSPAEGALTFSLAWPVQCAAQALSSLSLAVGVGLAEALRQLGVWVELKWPNDLLRDGRKLAGVLIETATTSVGQRWAVIGIGLNLRMPDALEVQIGQAVADAPWLAQMERSQLLASLLNALAHTLDTFEAQGFAPFVTRWNAVHAYAGRLVQICESGCVLQEGRALGVDAEGRLLLETNQGIVPVWVGDVSLRPAEGGV